MLELESELSTVSRSLVVRENLAVSPSNVLHPHFSGSINYMLSPISHTPLFLNGLSLLVLTLGVCCADVQLEVQWLGTSSPSDRKE